MANDKEKLVEATSKLHDVLNLLNEADNFKELSDRALTVCQFLGRFDVIEHWVEEFKKLEDIAYLAKPYLRLDEVADYLSIAKSQAYKLSASGQFTIYKPGGKFIYIARKDLDKWIEDSKVLSDDELQKKIDANCRLYEASRKKKNNFFTK